MPTAASKQPTMRVDAIDPGRRLHRPKRAPLGNDNSMLDSVMLAFKDSRAVETINGRAAMIGWTAALYVELTSNTSFMHQLFNERTFTLADGITRTSTYPAAGFFLVPACVILTLASSLAPALKKSSPNGLDEAPEAFGPFRAEAEMTNGRGAMIGLVALPIVEKIIGRLRAVLIERYRTKINKQHFFKQGWAALTICAPPRQFSRR